MRSVLRSYSTHFPHISVKDLYFKNCESWTNYLLPQRFEAIQQICVSDPGRHSFPWRCVPRDATLRLYPHLAHQLQKIKNLIYIEIMEHCQATFYGPQRICVYIFHHHNSSDSLDQFAISEGQAKNLSSLEIMVIEKYGL